MQQKLYAARVHVLSVRREIRRRDLFSKGSKIAKSKLLHKVESMHLPSREAEASVANSPGYVNDEAACLDLSEMCEAVKQVYEKRH